MKNGTIGFVGVGVMGARMVRNLLKAGYAVRVFTRTRAKAEALLAAGASWADSPRAVAQGADATISIVGYPQDVEAVYFGTEGILAGAAPGSLAIDMTTSSPALARRIFEAAAERGVRSLDAPVSGGDKGAREGTLSIMVGGETEAFAAARAIFAALGRNIVHQGSAGSGQFAKMANQIAIASTMVGVCEAVHYAKRAGLEPATVLQSIEAGAAGSWSLSNLMPRALAGDYAPGFFVKHFVKDMGIALESADELGIELPGLALADSLYQRLIAAGDGDRGTQALFDLYERGGAAS